MTSSSASSMRADARRFWDAMRERLREFSLSLHPDKTRLIEFGRHAAQNREKRGLGKPETFKFLGFVLICGKSRRGDFQIRRKSRRDRMRAKLREIKEGLRQRWHVPIPETGKWLGANRRRIFRLPRRADQQRGDGAFRYHVTVLWHRQLCRRSQKGAPGVAADGEAGRRVSPQAAGPSSLAECALCRQTPEVGAECPNWARSDLCGGRSAMSVPTANNYRSSLRVVSRQNGLSSIARRPLHSISRLAIACSGRAFQTSAGANRSGISNRSLEPIPGGQVPLLCLSQFNCFQRA